MSSDSPFGSTGAPRDRLDGAATLAVVPTGPLGAAVAVPAGLTVQHMVAVGDAALAGKSANTRRAYASALRTWDAWCATRQIPAEAASDPLYVAAYITEMVSRRPDGTAGKSIATVDVFLAAAGDRYENPGLTPGQGPWGHASPAGPAPHRRGRPKEPGAPVVHRRGEPNRRLDRRLVAAGTSRPVRDPSRFAAGLRRPEIAALRVCDVAVQARGLNVLVARGNGDQEGKGTIIGARRGSNPVTDPVTAVLEWVTAAEVQPDDSLFSTIAWCDSSVRCRGLTGYCVATGGLRWAAPPNRNSR